VPFGGNVRYDCVVDDGVRLSRVQVKTGFLDGFGAIRWATRSVRFYDGATRDYYGQADLFAVWVPETRRCYLVPVDQCGRREATLRVVPPRSGQRRGIRPASDYELKPITHAEPPAIGS
jgi:hypothetical protein